MPLKCTCPGCKRALLLDGAVPARIKCPKCGTAFKPEGVEEKPADPLTKKGAAADRDPFNFDDVTPTKTGQKSRQREDGDDDDTEKPARYRKQTIEKKSFPVWLPISIAAAVAAIAVVIVIALSSGQDDKKKVSSDDKPDAPRADPKHKPVAKAPEKNNPPKKDPPDQVAQVPPKKDPPDQVAQVLPKKDPPDQVAQVPPKKDPPDQTAQVPPKKDPPDQAIRDSDPNFQVPALPPPEKRPFLVLDPGGHTSFVRRVFLTPDNTQAITVSADKTIRIWDVETGDPVKTIHMPNGPGAEGALAIAAITSDGKKVAATGVPVGRGKFGIPVYLVSLESGQIEKVFKGQTNVVSSLAFSADNKWLAAGCHDGHTLVTNVETGQIALEIKGHKQSVSGVVFHPTDGRLATCSGDGTARIWKITKGDAQFTELRGHDGAVISIAWSPDGPTIATGGVDGTIRLWSSEGKPLKTFAKELFGDKRDDKFAETQMTSLWFTRDSKEILYTGIAFRGQAGILNIAAAARRVHFAEHSNTVQHGNLSPDSSLAISAGGDDNETFIWKVADGSVVQRIQGSGKSVWAAAWSADSKGIAWGNINQGTALPLQRPMTDYFRLDTLEPAKLPKPLAASQPELAGYSISLADFFHIKVKHGGEDDWLFESPQKNERIYSASLMDDGLLIVGGSFNQLLVDLKTKKIIREFKGHGGIITSVAIAPGAPFFATSSVDQTIRIWNPNKDEPVLSLFFAGREWIAWTPEGYYCASANGERLMGWQINNGVDKVGAFYPAVQFRQSLYQPEVIKNLFRANGNLRDALALAVKEKQKPIGAVNLTQVLPPEVAITFPVAAQGGVNLKDQIVEIAATARSTNNQPVRAMRLLIDGRPYQGQRGLKVFENPQPGEAKASWKVPLAPGKHILNVQAESAVSKGLSEPLELMQTAGKQRLPSLFVLAVGVNDYPGAMKLHYAATDAQAIARVLHDKTKGVFEKADIKLILNKEATKTNVLQGLNWLESNMTEQDIGIFFFSGHGGKDDDDNFYLVPVDIGRDIAKTGVSGDVVKQKLSDMPGRLVAIFDACHSGAAAESLRPAGRTISCAICRPTIAAWWFSVRRWATSIL